VLFPKGFKILDMIRTLQETRDSLKGVRERLKGGPFDRALDKDIRSIEGLLDHLLDWFASAATEND
jgi:hypothetical protein